ncbi:phospholipase B1, membrane-associated isoform X2 [Sardina pilchardus]
MMAEILSLFNPHLATLLPDVSTFKNRDLLEQAEDLASSLSSHEVVEGEQFWRLLLVFVSVDELQVCPGQEDGAVSSATKEVEEMLSTLQSRLRHTLVRVVVWSENSEVIHTCEDVSISNRGTLEKAILTGALQESLSDLLAARQWFGKRDDFGAVLVSSPLTTDQTTDQHTLRLWAEMLQPMKDQSGVYSDDLTKIACPTEEMPYLRTQENSKSVSLRMTTDTQSAPRLNNVTGSELPCVDRNPSPSIPTSVHALRPGDIKVVAALGDSLTAANGVGSAPSNLLDVMTEYRGLSWCIGGDENLTNVTTLPNILREFNPSVVGFSLGTGSENSPKAFLNQAVPGANAHDMPAQARVLIQKMKNDSRIDFQNDWKMITMFIGGNDLCDHCSDSLYFSPGNIVSRVREALDILHAEVPRAFVNLVEVMYIVPLRELHLDKSVNCPTFLVNLLCRCVMKPIEGTQELRTLADINRAYQRGMRDLVDSGLYDKHDNFTVVLQPFFREVVIPLLEDGRPDRSYFSPDCFHLSEKAHALMARALWNNMLEPVGNKTSTYDFSAGLSLECPSQSAPYLRTYKNSDYTYPGPPTDPPPPSNWGSDFSCTDTAPSPTVPTSVHRLRPGDINVVASLGDSITAGFGAKAKNILQLPNEERGVSWSIGGDETLETVSTLPNILKKFNPDVYGFSKGRSGRPNGFNVAISGAKAGGIPGQVQDLITAWKNDKNVNWENDWKLVTLFIGGNDLCQYCHNRDSLSTWNYTNYLRESLDMLYNEVPRVLVNVVEILEIEDLRKINSNGLGCTVLQPNLCPCFIQPGENSPELYEMKRINRELQAYTEALVDGGRYDGREDFAVVNQPFFQNSVVPMTEAGQPDTDFFSVDCFHFSERGHAGMAIALWNNMLEPVGSKQVYNNFTHDRSKIQCPTKDRPFIFTRVNSAPPGPTTPPVTTTAAHVPDTPAPLECSSGLPSWATALLTCAGLLLGWAVTSLTFYCRKRRSRKNKKALPSVEMASKF